MVNLSSAGAMLLLLFTTIIWGSWYQCIKRLDGWPVSAFMLWMYTFSAFIVWGLLFLLKPLFMKQSVLQSIKENPRKCIFCLVCGAIFCCGVQLNMIVIKNIGLILSTSISATCSVLIGTFTSCYFGGLREGQSIVKIISASLILIAAAIICQFSAKMRDVDNGKAKEKEKYKNELKNRTKNILLLLCGAVFLTPAYAIAQSVTVKTDLKPDGIPPILCIGMLSIGSMLGTWIVSGIQLTIKRQWKVCLQNRKGVLMSLFSAFCHYGGNVGYCISAPVLSFAVAWPIGTSFNLWQYIWGILFGEFKGTKRRTKWMLFTGIMLFIVGVLILS